MNLETTSSGVESRNRSMEGETLFPAGVASLLCKCSHEGSWHSFLESFACSSPGCTCPEFRNAIDRIALVKILFGQGVSFLPRTRGTKDQYPFPYTEYYNGRTASLEEALSWLKQGYDLAIVCGVNGARVLDFDSVAAYTRHWDKKLATELPSHTLCVRTFRGIQVFFFDLSQDLSSLKSVVDAKAELETEIFIHSHLAAFAGNLHPEGVTYELMGTEKILRKDGIVKVAIERLRSLHWTGSEEEGSYSGSGQIRAGDLGLTDSQMCELTEILVQLWCQGQHHSWVVSNAGWLIRLGISEIVAVRFLAKLAGELGCSRRPPCLPTIPKQIKDLYKATAKRGAHIPGVSSLLELAKNQNRSDLADKLLRLNKDLRQDIKIRTSIDDWMQKHGYSPQ